MGKIRTHSSHKFWTESEINILIQNYFDMPWEGLAALLPSRTPQMFRCKASSLGLKRYKPPKMTADEVREFKRNSMARRRKENPEAVRATDRKRYAKRRAEVKVYVKAWREKHFFGARVGRIKGSTAADLARIWKNQRGRCAYTGKKLDRSAQMDHIIPRALGGTDDLCNIQWVCPEINYAKRDLTHAQFIEMCGSVVEWIGKRIQMVEELINGIS